jgi:hypothetical protein
MAGLVPAIHVLGAAKKDVDGRNKCGHDDAVRSHFIAGLPSEIVKQPSSIFAFVACPDGEPDSTSPGHASPFSLRDSRASCVLNFVGRSVTSGFFFLSRKKRERSAVGRGGRDRADQARRPASTTSEDGLALRRSTAASSRLSPRPWDPAALWSRLGLSAPGGDTERARGVCLTPGGLIQDRPGSRLRSVTAGAAPPSRSVRSRTPLR